MTRKESSKFVVMLNTFTMSFVFKFQRRTWRGVLTVLKMTHIGVKVNFKISMPDCLLYRVLMVLQVERSIRVTLLSVYAHRCELSGEKSSPG